MADFWNKQRNPALPPFTHMLCSLCLTVTRLIPPTLRIMGLHPLKTSPSSLDTLQRRGEAFWISEVKEEAEQLSEWGGSILTLGSWVRRAGTAAASLSWLCFKSRQWPTTACLQSAIWKSAASAAAGQDVGRRLAPSCSALSRLTCLWAHSEAELQMSG